MSSHTDKEETHVIPDKSVSQEGEGYSRPSSSDPDHIHQQEELEHPDELAQDKEAQIDARSTPTTESAIPPPPDGGLHAWLKVFGGFLIYINIWSVELQQALPYAAKTNT
jgi:hypothetical protein